MSTCLQAAPLKTPGRTSPAPLQFQVPFQAIAHSWAVAIWLQSSRGTCVCVGVCVSQNASFFSGQQSHGIRGSPSWPHLNSIIRKTLISNKSYSRTLGVRTSTHLCKEWLDLQRGPHCPPYCWSEMPLRARPQVSWPAEGIWLWLDWETCLQDAMATWGQFSFQ